MHKEKSALGFWLPQSLLSTFILASVATVVAAGTPTRATQLAEWRFNKTANQLEITLKEGTTPRYFVLTQPLRIVLDLPNTQLGKVETQQTYSGAVRQIRVSQFQPDITRIVLELSPEVVLQPEQVQLRSVSSLNRWVLRPLIASSQIAVRAPASATILPPATFENTRRSAVVVKVPPLDRPYAELGTPTPLASTTGSTSPSQRATPKTAAPEVVFGQPLPASRRLEVQSQPSTVPTPSAQTPVAEDATAIPVETGVMSATTAKPAVVVPPLGLSRAAKPVTAPISPASGSVAAGDQNALLRSGTTLALRYPGKKALTLQTGLSPQEVLVLQEAIRDRAGNIIAPAGTPVIGRFETDSRGSRFIVQAITIGDRNIPISARSLLLSGNRRSQNRIEPNQILPVQLQEDLRSAIGDY